MKTLPALIATVAAALFLAPLATAAPANDNFGAAMSISGANGSQLGNSSTASKEVGEPAHAGNSGGRSIWYSWTAPSDGTFVFDTFPSTFDTLLAVYTGSDVSALAEVASNDDAVVNIWEQTTRSMVAFVATEGTTYSIAIDGFNGKHGRATLRWRNGVANDFFEMPQTLTGISGKVGGRNVWATMQTDEPSTLDSLSSVWYEWTAPATQLVKFSTLGAHFDSVLAVYTGTSVNGLTEIVSNDDDPLFSCCASSFVGFEAVAGTNYRIAVGGWGGQQGSFALSWSPLILGTAGNDTLVGTAAVEEIRGLGGNDVLRGLGAADVLVGGPGNDRAFGGPGNDTLIDRHGSDMLVGGSGVDLLDAADFVRGDILDGGPGADICRGERRDVRRGC